MNCEQLHYWARAHQYRPNAGRYSAAPDPKQLRVMCCCARMGIAKDAESLRLFGRRTETRTWNHITPRALLMRDLTILRELLLCARLAIAELITL